MSRGCITRELRKSVSVELGKKAVEDLDFLVARSPNPGRLSRILYRLRETMKFHNPVVSRSSWRPTLIRVKVTESLVGGRVGWRMWYRAEICLARHVLSRRDLDGWTGGVVPFSTGSQVYSVLHSPGSVRPLAVSQPPPTLSFCHPDCNSTVSESFPAFEMPLLKVRPEKRICAYRACVLCMVPKTRCDEKAPCANCTWKFQASGCT